MNKKQLEPEFIGYTLLQRGFIDWFRYCFRVLEQRPYIIEPLHTKLLDCFRDIYDGKHTRICISLPPRSSKTTLSTYFVVYCLTVNPKSQIIYTSYSQSLLGEIANKVASILENPIYKAMYPINRFVSETIQENPVSEFWRDYLFETTGQNKYSSKMIKTSQGGIVLFASVGSQITGYGASVRNSKGFSGALIIDDAQKPSDTKSAVLRKKVHTYFEETLLSRLNNPDTPIINVQQRLHLEDLTGFLLEKYNFEKLSLPLLNDDGSCNIPSQYTDERIAELKKSNYMFSAQYQQQPIIQGGDVIKGDWFGYYTPSENYNYKKLLITADTALKTKEHNDYSVFMFGGVSEDNKLHIIDMIRGKWEAPELKRKVVDFWNKYRIFNNKRTQGCYIEDKASGIGVIQELTRCGMPIIPMTPTKDKLTRVEEVTGYLEAGQVLLPYNRNYGFNNDLISECEAFSRDDSHLHDDMVDTLVYMINYTIQNSNVSIFDVL